jgi:hypothetical protein
MVTKQPPRFTPIAFLQTLAIAKAADEATFSHTQNPPKTIIQAPKALKANSALAFRGLLRSCLPRKLTLATPFYKPRSYLVTTSYNHEFAPARPLAGGGLMAGAIRPTKQPPRFTPIAFPQTLAIAKAASEATPSYNHNPKSKIYNQKSLSRSPLTPQEQHLNRAGCVGQCEQRAGVGVNGQTAANPAKQACPKADCLYSTALERI